MGQRNFHRWVCVGPTSACYLGPLRSGLYTVQFGLIYNLLNLFPNTALCTLMCIYSIQKILVHFTTDVSLYPSLKLTCKQPRKPNKMVIRVCLHVKMVTIDLHVKLTNCKIPKSVSKLKGSLGQLSENINRLIIDGHQIFAQ